MAEWYEDKGFLKGLDQPQTVPPPSSGPAPSGTATGDWVNDTKFLKSLDEPQIPEEKPSLVSRLGAAAKVGLKSGLSEAMKMYEIPSRPILEATGLGTPGTFASEQLKPTPQEEEAGSKAGIPGEIVKGVAGVPGAFAKYGPLMGLTGGMGVFATAMLGGGEEAAEQLSSGKKLDPLRIVEQAAILGIFKGIEPLGRAAKAAILGGTFSTQAFADTYGQTKDIVKSLHSAIAPGVIGAGMGAMGGGKGEERPIPRPGEEGMKQIPAIPESRYQMGTPGYPRPEELPHPIVPYQAGGPMVDTGKFFGYNTVPPRPEPTRGLGWTPTGSPPPEPDWIREGRDWPPPQYPPVPYEPRATGKPLEAKTTPTPATTPPKGEKGLEAPVRPATDKQMASIRDNSEKIGGLSLDLIKRWTGLGTKRANSILEDLISKGEIEGSEPGDPYPWRLKGGPPKAETGPDRGFIEGTYKDKLSKEFNDTIQKRFPDDKDARDLHNGVADLYFDIEKGQPGRRIFSDAGRVGEGSNIDVMREPSTYPDFISSGLKRESGAVDKISREEALRSLKKGLMGEKLGKKEADIWAKAKKESREAVEEMKTQAAHDREEYERLQKEYPGTVEDWLKNEEATNSLTKHLDDEIMGLKEELRETYPDDEISTAVEKATKTIAAEGVTPDAQRIEQEIRSLLTPKPAEVEAEPPKLSPTEKDQFALPGIKQGLEMKGAKEGAAPTLEGSPLMEAARKAEQDAQPKLFGEGKISPADFQATPEKFIPDDLIVDAKAIREKTGKEVTVKQNAKEAFSEITDRLKRFKDFWDCVKS